MRPNTHKEGLHLAELDKDLGYNFLKKCKVDVMFGIFQIFESRQSNAVLVVSNKGDLFKFDFKAEVLSLLVENPNNNDISKQFEKVKSAELFDDGSRVVVSMGNGDLLIYQITSQDKEIQMLAGPFGIDLKEGRKGSKCRPVQQDQPDLRTDSRRRRRNQRQQVHRLFPSVPLSPHFHHFFGRRPRNCSQKSSFYSNFGD